MYTDTTSIDDHSKRLDALEAHAVETDDTLSILRGRIDNDADALVQRLAALESLVLGRRDGGHWIDCPFCADEELGVCSACNGTRRIWEMPREDVASCH